MDYDPYRRSAEAASIEDGLRATRRFIAAAILAAEHDAAHIDSGASVVEAEAWAFNCGVAEGLRKAQRALSADPSIETVLQQEVTV